MGAEAMFRMAESAVKCSRSVMNSSLRFTGMSAGSSSTKRVSDSCSTVAASRGSGRFITPCNGDMCYEASTTCLEEYLSGTKPKIEGKRRRIKAFLRTGQWSEASPRVAADDDDFDLEVRSRTPSDFSCAGSSPGSTPRAITYFSEMESRCGRSRPRPADLIM